MWSSLLLCAFIFPFPFSSFPCALFQRLRSFLMSYLHFFCCWSYFLIRYIYSNSFIHSFARSFSRSPLLITCLFKDCQRHIGDKLALESHILKPVQRYPQLRLQVLALVKRTSRSHPDVKFLQDALGCLSSTARRLDNHRRVAIDKQKAWDVLRKLKRSKAAKLVGAGGTTPGAPSFGGDVGGAEGREAGKDPLLVRWDEVSEVVSQTSALCMHGL